MQQLLLPIVLFGALGAMMFFSMRKQKRQAAETRQMQDSIVPGTRVMTTSGMHATVTAVADDTIELEISPGVRTTWVRAAVREVVVAAPSQDELLDSADFDSADFDSADFDSDEYDSTDTYADDRYSDEQSAAERPSMLEKRSKDVG